MFQLSPKAKKIIAALLPFVIMFAAIFGYNVTIVQPQFAELQAAGRGLFLPADFQDVHIKGDAIVDGSLAATTIVSQSIGFSGGTADFSGAVTNGSLAVGGGYGDTGCSLSAAGVLQCNGAATIDGAFTGSSTGAIAAGLTVGGGYGSTGCTFSTAGVLQCNGAATVDGALNSGALTAASSDIGGGFGSTGCSVSAAGDLQCDGVAHVAGALTVTGTSTLGAAVTVGGGYGDTGCSLSAAGVLQCNGAATIDGATTSTGLLNANAGIAVDTSAFTVADTSGNVATAGSLTVNGTSSQVGAVTFGALNIHSSVIVTPTADVPVTPTAHIVILQGTATGFSLAPCTTGQEIVVYDAVNAAMVITDTGNAVLAGDQTLGQFDALALSCISSKWVQFSAVSAN